jgi:hypothetical protein
MKFAEEKGMVGRGPGDELPPPSTTPETNGDLGNSASQLLQKVVVGAAAA